MDELATRIISSPEFQRLNRIKEPGLHSCACKVYLEEVPFDDIN